MWHVNVLILDHQRSRVWTRLESFDTEAEGVAFADKYLRDLYVRIEIRREEW